MTMSSFVKPYRINSFFYYLCFNSVILHKGNFRFHLNFCRFHLIFDMHMNRLMVIWIKEKTDSEYKIVGIFL